ncbi:hypothetical protein D3C73_15780 [compost metagenome]
MTRELALRTKRILETKEKSQNDSDSSLWCWGLNIFQTLDVSEIDSYRLNDVADKLGLASKRKRARRLRIINLVHQVKKCFHEIRDEIGRWKSLLEVPYQQYLLEKATYKNRALHYER